MPKPPAFIPDSGPLAAPAVMLLAVMSLAVLPLAVLPAHATGVALDSPSELSANLNDDSQVARARNTRSKDRLRKNSRKSRRAAKKISLDLQDAEIRNVIRLIADVSGLNIVVGDEVKGKVTMKLKQVPWDKALAVILKTKGLGMRWEASNIVRIALQADLDREDQRALEQEDECLKKGALKTKIIPVNYARAADLVPIVKDTLTERGRVTYDERTNVLIIKDVVCSLAFR